MKYRADIDGLRAVAVSSVLAYHLKLLNLPGGYLGVDIFFVISGYLITSLIINEIESCGTFSFSSFYLRRVRRILPAALAMLTGTAFAGYFVLVAGFWGGLYESVVASLLYVPNVYFYFGAGYWDATSSMKPLLHMWSLGIEEQFYILFPFVVIFCLRRVPHNRIFLVGVLIAMSLASWAFCLFLRKTNSEFAFFMLPTRMWELSVGAVAAALPRFSTAPKRPVIDALQLAAFSVVVFCLYNAIGGIGKWNTFVVAATAVLVLEWRGIITKFLECRFMVLLGKISYSLYLWHWPVWVLWTFRKTEQIQRTDSFLVLGATLFLSLATWLCVEKPFRRISSWGALGKLLAPPCLVLCCVSVLCLLFPRSNLQLDVPRPDPLQTLPQDSFQIEQDTIPRLGAHGTPQFVLMGDSHAGAFAPALHNLCQVRGITGVLMTSHSTFMLTPALQATRPNDREALGNARSALNYISKHGIKHLVIAQIWQGYLTEGVESAAVSALKELVAEGVHVYLIESVPVFSVRNIYAYAINGVEYLDADTNSTSVIDSLIQKVGSERVQKISVQFLFEHEGYYRFVKDGKMLYTDNQHINRYGANVSEPAFIGFVDKVVRMQGGR